MNNQSLEVIHATFHELVNTYLPPIQKQALVAVLEKHFAAVQQELENARRDNKSAEEA